MEKCDFCHLEFGNQKVRDVHLKMVHDLANQVKSEVNESEKPFEGELGQQKICKSGPSKPLECEICTKTFSKRKNLKKHQKIHKSEKTFECELCTKTFSKRKNLKAHQKIHSGGKPFECEICKKIGRAHV